MMTPDGCQLTVRWCFLKSIRRFFSRAASAFIIVRCRELATTDPIKCATILVAELPKKAVLFRTAPLLLPVSILDRSLLRMRLSVLIQASSVPVFGGMLKIFRGCMAPSVRNNISK